jgi:hypothetical protein
MGIAEKDAARGQAVQVRRLRLGMTVHAPDPIVQVVNGDHEHVRPAGLGSQNRRCSQQQSRKECPAQFSNRRTGTPTPRQRRHW